MKASLQSTLGGVGSTVYSIVCSQHLVVLAIVCSQHLGVLASLQSTLGGVGYSSVTGNITHYPTLDGVGQVAVGDRRIFLGGRQRTSLGSGS